MTLKITYPGDVYINREGHLLVLESYCLEPTADLVALRSGHRLHAGISGLMFEGIAPATEARNDVLIAALRDAATTIKALRDELAALQARVIEAQDRILDLQTEKLRPQA